MGKYCVNCAAELKEGADICVACGKFVIGANAPASAVPTADAAVRKNLFPGFALATGVVYAGGLFCLLNSYGLGDVYVPSWSDYYWYYTHYGWAMLATIVAGASVALAIGTLIVALSPRSRTSNPGAAPLAVFILVMTAFLLVAGILSVGNSW